MFLCSECGRSARVLYARHEIRDYRIWFFMCRKCAGITYQSTMGHRWDRSARWVEKLRARLQWRANASVPIKPRGMHERTYQRILGMLTYHEAIRTQGAGYSRKESQNSTAPIAGGSAKTGLWSLVDGRSANLPSLDFHFRAEVLPTLTCRPYQPSTSLTA